MAHGKTTDNHRRGPFRAEWFEGNRAERIQLWLSAVLQLAIFGLIVGALAEEQWQVAFAAAVVLALTFLPALIERQLAVQLPVEFTLFTCIFLYAAFALGEVGRFYQRFWWWDLLLHSISAMVLGVVGFLLVYVFYMTHRIRVAPVYVALFSFGFAVTLGTLWEIFEFAMDHLFGFGMQKSGLVDTMTDLMVDAIGALIAAVFGYQYVKGGDSLLVDRITRRFVAKNPDLFGK